MRRHPPLPWLRAESVAGNYAPQPCDYPVRLMTRRVYALGAEQIVEARGNAPMRVSSSWGPHRSLRPPC